MTSQDLFRLARPHFSTLELCADEIDDQVLVITHRDGATTVRLMMTAEVEDLVRDVPALVGVPADISSIREKPRALLPVLMLTSRWYSVSTFDVLPEDIH